MDECIPNPQLLLSENYLVQPVESIPISLIDYDKIEMTHLIHTGQFTNGVIQIADVNSNLKTKELHPLEAEIQRDLELKQQQAATTKRQTPSVIQSTPQDLLSKLKSLETTNSVFESVTPFQSINGKEQLNVSQSKAQDTCHVPSINNRPMVFEKKQFIIVSDNSVLLNVAPKDEVKSSSNKTDESVKKSEPIQTHLDEENLSNNKATAESDSENDGNDIEPVNDYEPDPDCSGNILEDEKEKPNKCYMCFKTFRQKKNMYAHIRKIHSIQPKIEGGILCPLCKMHALRQEHLRTHLETLHEIRIEKEEKLFTTMEEFLSWKEFIEKETLSFYVSRSSSKLLANNQQKTYYKCHRSGSYVTLKKENRKKKLKVQGSNKIGATCPASIEVTENIHGINVTFWKTHVGHENNLAHLVLSKEDKAKIMDYVVSGVSWDKILEIVKKEGTKGSSTPSRLTMISKQDLRNIKKIHEMKNSPELFSSRKKIIQGRKPIKEKMLRRASHSLVIEKADMLLNLLETTDVRPEFRPKICLMIDNLVSTIKRRAIKSSKTECGSQKKRHWIRQSSNEKIQEKERSNNSDADSNPEEIYSEQLDFCNNSDKSFSKQIRNTRISRRNSTKEGIQKKVMSKLCH